MVELNYQVLVEQLDLLNQKETQEFLVLTGWAGGVIYTWWGHDTYQDSGAQLAYVGRV